MVILKVKKSPHITKLAKTPSGRKLLRNIQHKLNWEILRTGRKHDKLATSSDLGDRNKYRKVSSDLGNYIEKKRQIKTALGRQ